MLPELMHEAHSHATIQYHPAERIIEVVWHDFVSGPAFRRTVTHCLDLAAAHGAHYWLANDANLRAIRAADRDWMMAVVLPRMARHGFRRLAGVGSTDSMAQMAVEEFANALARAVAPTPVRLFPDRLAAWAWLTERVPRPQTA